MADAVEVDDVDLALDEGSSESPRVAGDVTEDTVDTPAPAAGSDTADTQAAAGAESTAAPSDDTAPQGDAKADGGDGGAASGADDGSGHDDGGIVSVSGEVSAEVAALVEGALGRLSPAGAAPQGPAAPPEATRAARRGSGGIGGAAERPVSSERTGSVSSRDDSGLAIRRTLSNASRGSRGSKRSASFSVGSAASRPTSLLGALRRSPGELLVALRAALRDGGELPSVVQALSTCVAPRGPAPARPVHACGWLTPPARPPQLERGRAVRGRAAVAAGHHGAGGGRRPGAAGGAQRPGAPRRAPVAP